MNEHDRNWQPVETVQRTLDILEYLDRSNPSTLGEIAAGVGVAKSTAHRHLRTLVEEEYVVKEDNEYRLSVRFLGLGMSVVRHYDASLRIKEKVDEMAEESGERVHFLVEEFGWAVYLHRAYGEQAVKTKFGPGKRRYLHGSAAGKAILAFLPEERRDAIIEKRGLPKLTENTITDRDELEEELATVREKGYSQNFQENVDGLFAIGSPVLNQDNEVLGGLVISGPSTRLSSGQNREKLIELLIGSSEELSLNIKHSN